MVRLDDTLPRHIVTVSWNEERRHWSSFFVDMYAPIAVTALKRGEQMFVVLARALEILSSIFLKCIER